jgi:hypothetical protein
LVSGDKIRIAQNGFTSDGKHRLNNGVVYQLKGFTKTGDLKLTNGWVIDKNYGNLAHGYCQTSHVAQSKTVDRVFVAQSAASLGASSAEQFYVSVSRARDSVTVYTDDKARLAETIQSSGARMTAHELLKLSIAPNIVDPFESMLRERAIFPTVRQLPPDSEHENEPGGERPQCKTPASEAQKIKPLDFSKPERVKNGVSL